MLENTINALSDLMGIDPVIIPNIITFIVVVVILYLSFKGQLSWVVLLSIYGIAMAVLTLLGIDSVFNIISIIEEFVT